MTTLTLYALNHHLRTQDEEEEGGEEPSIGPSFKLPIASSSGRPAADGSEAGKGSSDPSSSKSLEEDKGPDMKKPRKLVGF